MYIHDIFIPFLPDNQILSTIVTYGWIIGVTNAINLIDGLDGLATSVTILVATFFTVVAVGTESAVVPITCATVGALLGFLLFNVHPASVFMGDTGSLALGGFVASTAYESVQNLRCRRCADR